MCLAKTTEEAMRATTKEFQDDTTNSEEDVQNEYVVERIVRHKRTYNGTKNVVRWYGYSSIDDTWEPSHYITQHFIQRHWERRKRARLGSPQESARI